MTVALRCLADEQAHREGRYEVLSSLFDASVDDLVVAEAVAPPDRARDVGT